eukprot:337016-Pleurochrysis_carterae.AAC.1
MWSSIWACGRVSLDKKTARCCGVSFELWKDVEKISFACALHRSSEQGSLWCVSPASKARGASNLTSKPRSALASKARSAPASKAHAAEVWRCPPLKLALRVSPTLGCFYQALLRLLLDESSTFDPGKLFFGLS